MTAHDDHEYKIAMVKEILMNRTDEWAARGHSPMSEEKAALLAKLMWRPDRLPGEPDEDFVARMRAQALVEQHLFVRDGGKPN